MVKTLKKQKIRFEDTLRFANFFTMALVSFSKGHVIVVSPPYLIRVIVKPKCPRNVTAAKKFH